MGKLMRVMDKKRLSRMTTQDMESRVRAIRQIALQDSDADVPGAYVG